MCDDKSPVLYGDTVVGFIFVISCITIMPLANWSYIKPTYIPDILCQFYGCHTWFFKAFY